MTKNAGEKCAMGKEGGIPGNRNRHLPAFLLLCLADGEAHGGALWNQITAMMPFHLGIESGAVYRVLRELEERGSVTSRWETGGVGPARRLYQMTENGWDELAAWQEDIARRKRNLEVFLQQCESLNRLQSLTKGGEPSGNSD